MADQYGDDQRVWESDEDYDRRKTQEIVDSVSCAFREDLKRIMAGQPALAPQPGAAAEGAG